MSKINQLETLLKDTPDDSFLQHALALEYIKEGNDEKAKAVFEKLLEANPDYVGSYYHLAKLLERTGSEHAAISIYQQGMEIAKKLGEQHAYGELKSAYEDLIF